MKAVLRGKFIALKFTHKENGESSHQRLNSTPESSRKKKEEEEQKTGNNQLRAEINKTETQKTIQRINETRAGSLRKST